METIRGLIDMISKVCCCFLEKFVVGLTVMPIKKGDPNSEKEDLKKTRFFRNRRPKEDLY